MAKAPTKSKPEAFVSKGTPVATPPACEDCRWVGLDNDRLVCLAPLPPQIMQNGKVPYVHTKFACVLFTRK